MAYIAQVRVAEPWSVWNLIGAAILVFVAVGVVYVATRRE